MGIKLGPVVLVILVVFLAKISLENLGSSQASASEERIPASAVQGP